MSVSSESVSLPPLGRPLRPEALSLRTQLAGKQLVVVGGTGFLGKVWLSLLLDRFPEVGHVYLVVRPKEGLGVTERFTKKVLTSEVFVPLRQRHGDAFESFVRERVTPIAGDVSQILCGTSAELRDEIRGTVAAVVNVAGIVDFSPPLDEALEVNAFGCQNLVALARDLGNCPVLHTSTCFTAGSRTGPIEELDPREIPFPRALELGVQDWDPDREISECLDVIEQARHRAGDAFRQTHFADEAKANLRARNEPTSGQAYEEEFAKVRRRFVERQLAELGTERARFWGWPNTYTYTKSLGEQIVASSGLRFCIARPAIVESTNEYPFPGWNEGINTSAPFIFLIREGGLQLPGSSNNLDLIPCDMVCAGILLALGELLEGSARPVYQLAASDRNPCSMARFFELSGLHKRRLIRETGKGGPILSELSRRFETAMLSKEEYQTYGPSALARGARKVSAWTAKAAVGPLRQPFKSASTGLEQFASQQEKLARIMDTFLPFTADYQYIFKTDCVYSAFERLAESEQALLPWGPESIDWRTWFLEVHAPALERHVFPEMEARLKRKKPAPRAHESLTTLLDQAAERFERRVALARAEDDGLARLSYQELRSAAQRTAARLRALGVERGDRVLLGGANHPAWAVALFGIAYAGATAVPFDPQLDPESLGRIARVSRSKLLLGDEAVLDRLSSRIELPCMHLFDALEARRDAAPQEGDWGARQNELALLIYTSGTTGDPKGVMLSHRNVTSLVASLAPLFPLTPGDRLISVLPLHHTFELSCGLLLPLSRGSRIVYLDELTSDRLTETMKETRTTALIGVPALWEMIERKVFSRVQERGAAAAFVFQTLLELNRQLGRTTGIDLGRSLFGSVHRELGGSLRYLVSGGAALHPDTHGLFQGLGLHLAEGYGLTEAAPVLTVASGGPRARAGHVGRAIPGVEIRIERPNQDGVGQVLARGPNVMQGYSDDPEATLVALGDDGWLRTGDLGKLDSKGRLTLIGRSKDVVVGRNGENLYPDDIEARLGAISGVQELCILGIPDGRGGERLACVLVAEEGTTSSVERHERARASFDRQALELPVRERPTAIVVVDRPLPRTSTKKVQRPKLRRLFEQSATVTSLAPSAEGDEIERVIREIVAKIARRGLSDVSPQSTLRGDLGFDSLMALELLVGLETKLGSSFDGELLARATTVTELSENVRRQLDHRPSRTSRVIDDDQAAAKPLELPPLVRSAAKQVLGTGQRRLYERLFETKVVGRTFIPYNRHTLVVANHASHLDQGLVKSALGAYGEGLMTLAAQDYFFEGRYKKAYFEQLTNLVPMSRNGSLRGALREAGDLLNRGKTVLIFPEGTRSADGRLRPFKAAMGHLALRHEVDILPIWLEGTHAVLPKGNRIPRGRRVEARIGPPLSVTRLREATRGLSSSDSARVVTKVAFLAVQALSRGSHLSMDELDFVELRRSEIPEPEGLLEVMKELEERFVPGAIDAPLSFYFSLGDERWTVRATQTELEVARGKTVESADCVLKTSPQNFERIIRQAWVPGPADFMSGQIKTNNVQHLLSMKNLFRLNIPSDQLRANRPRTEEEEA